ncbi:MAG: Tm-1-like ATP-binding domain-containing protein, partial [Geminicoccaceae bacterium]
MTDKTILIVGTYDTKHDELDYMAERIRAGGGGVLTMDMSVLGDPEKPTDITKHDVTAAAGSSIQAAIDSGDENTAMQIMAAGASALAKKLQAEGRFDGVVILGGTMGTDAALDICQALPLGVPKYVVSTVSFSPLIPPDRLSADIQM